MIINEEKNQQIEIDEKPPNQVRTEEKINPKHNLLG